MDERESRYSVQEFNILFLREDLKEFFTDIQEINFYRIFFGEMELKVCPFFVKAMNKLFSEE